MSAVEPNAPSKHPELQTHRTILNVSLTLDEKEKWRGEINNCDVAFWGPNNGKFWCWTGMTPHKWGACLAGIHFGTLQAAILDAKERCVPPPVDPPKKKK